MSDESGAPKRLPCERAVGSYVTTAPPSHEEIAWALLYARLLVMARALRDDDWVTVRDAPNAVPPAASR